VVKVEPGRGTGDNIVTCDDGTVWRTLQLGEHQGTGDIWGRSDGGILWEIEENKPERSEEDE